MKRAFLLIICAVFRVVFAERGFDFTLVGFGVKKDEILAEIASFMFFLDFDKNCREICWKATSSVLEW